MATSLKSLTPALARILGESPAALYERQRALVREGVLESSPGHGPGSGVRATPETVALLLISMLASNALSDAGPRTRLIAETSTKPGPPCNVTRASRFADALARIFSDLALAERVKVITVAVTHGYAGIEFNDKRLTGFVGRMAKKRGIRLDAAIGPETIQAVAKIVTGLEKEAAE